MSGIDWMEEDGLMVTYSCWYSTAPTIMTSM